MLGVHLAPDGNWDAEVDYLTLVVVDWKVRMAASRLYDQCSFQLKECSALKTQLSVSHDNTILTTVPKDHGTPPTTRPT